MLDKKEYWIIVDGQRVGPLTLEQIRRYPMDRETMVWHTGLPAWRQAGFMPELADIVDATLPGRIDPYAESADSGKEAAAVTTQSEWQAQAEIAASAQAEEAADAGEPEAVAEDAFAEEALAEEPVAEEPAAVTPVAEEPVAVETATEPVAMEQPLEQWPNPTPQPTPWSQPEAQRTVPPKPPTYLAWSIVSLICCCCIPAIVAIIYASKVTPCYDRGDYEAAKKASETAELWVILAITLGIVLAPFQYLLQALL